MPDKKNIIEEALDKILALPLRDSELEDFKTLKELNNKNITVGQAIVAVIVKMALKENATAIRIVWDILGRAPTPDKNKNTEILTSFLKEVTREGK